MIEMIEASKSAKRAATFAKPIFTAPFGNTV
jgi:hypothetical protein